MQRRSKEAKQAGARKRESGEPGGGKGRRDVVRGSRIYPMSGPLPRGKAVIRTEAEWGQGERGAAGYEDHGESGLEAGMPWQLKRSHRSAKAAASRRRARASDEFFGGEEVPLRNWSKFFNNLNRRHAGWFAEIEVHEAGDTTEVQARRLPFEGITVDMKPGALNTTSVILEMQQNVHLNHMVPRTKRIEFKDDREPMILIISANGDRTIVHLYPPPRNPKLLVAGPRRSRRTAGG